MSIKWTGTSLAIPRTCHKPFLMSNTRIQTWDFFLNDISFPCHRYFASGRQQTSKHTNVMSQTSLKTISFQDQDADSRSTNMLNHTKFFHFELLNTKLHVNVF